MLITKSAIVAAVAAKVAKMGVAVRRVVGSRRVAGE